MLPTVLIEVNVLFVCCCVFSQFRLVADSLPWFEHDSVLQGADLLPAVEIRMPLNVFDQSNHGCQ
jgi:hypothetical protein